MSGRSAASCLRALSEVFEAYNYARSTYQPPLSVDFLYSSWELNISTEFESNTCLQGTKLAFLHRTVNRTVDLVLEAIK